MAEGNGTSTLLGDGIVELMNRLEDGALVSHLEDDLREVVSTLKKRHGEQGGSPKATLTIRLKFCLDSGLITVTPEVKADQWGTAVAALRAAA